MCQQLRISSPQDKQNQVQLMNSTEAPALAHSLCSEEDALQTQTQVKLKQMQKHI